jgi:hypothetical protein
MTFKIEYPREFKKTYDLESLSKQNTEKNLELLYDVE